MPAECSGANNGHPCENGVPQQTTSRYYTHCVDVKRLAKSCCISLRLFLGPRSFPLLNRRPPCFWLKPFARFRLIANGACVMVFGMTLRGGRGLGDGFRGYLLRRIGGSLQVFFCCLGNSFGATLGVSELGYHFGGMTLGTFLGGVSGSCLGAVFGGCLCCLG